MIGCGDVYGGLRVIGTLLLVSTFMIEFLFVFEASSPVVFAFQLCFAFAS